MEPNVFDIFNLETNNIKPKKGRILISEPFLDDTMFKRSVILLTEYNSEGAMGFVLNKFIDNPNLKKAVKQEFLGTELHISYGGPVSQDQIFFLYSANEMIVNKSVEILPGLFMGGDYEHLRELVITEIIKTDKVRFFSGYSGWSAGQLENEIKANYWLVKNIKIQEVLKPDNNIWRNQINQLEEKYKMWTLVPEDPQLN
ncbi:MAG: YqgE/AlgH family protein [Bacteroidales bacterium]|nr:YqgE/AlgH family protein [Bacteroidales bacterium]